MGEKETNRSEDTLRPMKGRGNGGQRDLSFSILTTELLLSTMVLYVSEGFICMSLYQWSILSQMLYNPMLIRFSIR